jgi:protein-tyrosine phosphatase
LFQLNTVSLSGHYGSEVKKIAEKLIDQEMYEFAGSDMHNQNYMNSFVKARYRKEFEKTDEFG